jgi:hypothetical protein
MRIPSLAEKRGEWADNEGRTAAGVLVEAGGGSHVIILVTA